MRLVITGGRNWTDVQAIKDAIDECLLAHDVDPSEVTFIHGAARGADTIGAQIAEEMGMKIEEYAANWRDFGKAAGPIRNKQMIVEGKPDVCLAFLQAESRGTANMILQCRKAGIPTIVYEGM